MISLHDPVDHVGKASLEGPSCLRRRLPFSDLAEVAVLSAAAVADLADGDGVQDGVQRAVATGVEPVADATPASAASGSRPPPHHRRPAPEAARRTRRDQGTPRSRPHRRRRHPAPPSSADVAANYCRQASAKGMSGRLTCPLALFLKTQFDFPRSRQVQKFKPSLDDYSAAEEKVTIGPSSDSATRTSKSRSGKSVDKEDLHDFTTHAAIKSSASSSPSPDSTICQILT